MTHSFRRGQGGTKQRIRRALAQCALAAAWAMATPAFAERLEHYPELDEASVRSAIVVVELRAPRELAPFPHCDSPDVVCLDPPPFAMEATVRETLHGVPVPARVEVASTSHYGPGPLADHAGPYLAWFRTDGRGYEMRRYAAARLEQDRLGQWHLVLRKPVPWFLPCSTDELKQEIAEGDFPDLVEVPLARLRQEGIDEDDRAYRITATGAMPRWSIPLEALRRHLATFPPSAKLYCESEE